jgi:hypothetical protein
MTIAGQADSAAADRHHPEMPADSLAMIGVATWFREDPRAVDEHDEAVRASTHRDETHRLMVAAARAHADARARVSNLEDKDDLDGRKMFGFGLGAVMVMALMALDAIPLNWAAQAFGLDAADSWLVTMILLAASVGAMAGLEVTAHDARRRRGLLAIVLAGYAGLVALRTSFLVTVDGESFLAAVLQALVLSAFSAGLVVIGSAVMARTRPRRLSQARAEELRARRVSAAAEHAWRRADEKFNRQFGVLRRLLARQPLYVSVPAGVTHGEWVAALESALRAHFTAQC